MSSLFFPLCLSSVDENDGDPPSRRNSVSRGEARFRGKNAYDREHFSPPPLSSFTENRSYGL